MQKILKRILTLALSFSMIVSALAPAVPAIIADAAEQLVNIATDATATTENNTYGTHVIENVNDGDLTTDWQTRGDWPSTAVLDLGQGRDIAKVVVVLGGDENASRSVDVTVEYAQSGITTDLITMGTKTVALTGDKTAEITVDTPISATHIYVTLSNPMQGGSTVTFWPSVSEIEVYEVKPDTGLSAYNNIADEASISVTGGKEHATAGSANLVDGSDSTLYKFYNARMTSEQTITLSYEEARSMDAFRIVFENVGTTDSNDYLFTYSIQAKNEDGEYDTIVANATANRTDNSSQEYQFEEKVYSEVQIIMHSCTTDAGTLNGWPAIAEFEIYGSEIEVKDEESIAWGKPVHASSGKSQAQNVTDGSKNTVWRGSYYPAYVDIDLEENYYLDTVEVYTPESGYSQYTIYTSMDGRDFDKLAEKTSTESASLETGEVYQGDGKEARIVRVYLEYNSSEATAALNEVRVTGTASGTEVQERPEIDVVDFEDSEYADLTVTAQDTYDEVYGIIERRLGEEYKDWFTLELENSTNGYDYYELSMVDGKVHVKGNDGVSMATGINHYLKYYCNVNISQVGDQVNMPETIPEIDGTVHKETKAEVRYSYNYCTLSYSMAFWGEEEWRDELDWLALNGVNVVLDLTGQEEVWRRFLGELGYKHEDIKDFIAGPAYYAWAYMANLSGFGGPVHDSWFEERTELARKNHQIMRNLGMQPVLQGYCGMVPNDIQDYDADVQIISQGTWQGIQRPDMLITTSDTFDEYAALYYQCQKEVYGDTTDYYATDPFHEGGNTGGMDYADVSREVLTSMLEADEDGIWIIQSWQKNPTTAFLNGLDNVTDSEGKSGSEHALILDLYAEKTPHYNSTSYGDEVEFDSTPWIFCMLNNFGGRLGLHGHLDNLAEDIPYALNNCEYIKGVGITPEASVNNPVLYDFLFETIWQDDVTEEAEVIDLDTWLDAYATRRYGAESESANQAWDILKDTVYKSDLNGVKQGAPESVVNARPALSISSASAWGSTVISYDKGELEKAAKLLLADYDKLKDSEGYMYDVANVLQQVLSNSAQEYQTKMANAFNEGNLEDFEKYSKAFLEIIDYMETVTATNEYFLLGRWVEQAKALADNADDFTKELYELNAKALVTTWGSYKQAESGKLHDYSNRQWSGLIGDFYKVRWERWINARISELKGEEYEESIHWFEWEWEWVRSNKTYTTTPTETDLSVAGAEILEKYALATTENIALNKECTSSGAVSATYAASNATDGNTSSYWDAGAYADRPWIIVDLENIYELYSINPITYWQLSRYYHYEVYTSVDGETYTLYGEKTNDNLATASGERYTSDETVYARYIKLVGTYNSANTSFHLNELRAYGILVPEDADYTALDAVIEEAEGLTKDIYTDFSEVETALEEAKALSRELTTEDQQSVIDAAEKLRDAIDSLQLKPADYSAVDTALAKVPADLNIYTDETVKAVNDAIAAVDRDKKITEQSEVDKMAQAIEAAIAVLTLKPADYSAVEAAIVNVPTDLTIYTDETVKVVQDAVVTALMNNNKDASQQSEVDAMAKAIDDAVAALELKDADYTLVDRALASVPTDLSVYTDETVKAVTDAVAEVVDGKKITEQETVDAWAEAIVAAVQGLQYKAAAYDAINDALAQVPEDLTIYTKESVDVLNAAIAAVENDKDITDQATVDAWAQAILDAIDALEVKDADYSKVEAALAKVPTDMSIYTDETVKAVNDAVEAVVEGKKVTEQAEVDDMAQTIEDAIAGLELKDADYTAVEEAIAKVPEDLGIYTRGTAKAVTNAVAAVVEGLKITEQSEVDAMAQAIEDALAALELKSTFSGVIRVAGDNRYETGFKVADTYKETLGVEKFQTALVATGKNFADALPGSYLAYVKQAPILLTNEKEEFMDSVVTYITENVEAGADVYILGGTAVVPAEMDEKLTAAGYHPVRLAGENRYETNVKILEAAGMTGGEIIVATGRDFADSLSASAVGKPILLVKDQLNDLQKEYLNTLEGSSFYIVGGEAAVGKDVEKELGAYGTVLDRLAGRNRRETSVLIAQNFFGDPTAAVTAYAGNFPDGLCGGPLAAELNVPLILTVDGKTTEAADYMAAKNIALGYVLGGEKVLADETVGTVFGLESTDEIIVK